jgi:DtxR family Mn-dependent transcriptional regulator
MSESEEMYLISLARANEAGQDPVPLAQLAKDLNVQTVSANQMIRKLSEANKVAYMPYKGVSLTPIGQVEAARILRRRRLWEVFLTEKLSFPPVEADQIACQLEHAASDEVVERLSAFLGAPQSSPQGKPIPAAPTGAVIALELGMPLTLAGTGVQLIVTAFHLDETEKSFLRQAGIWIGARLSLLALQQDGACLVQPQDYPMIQFASSLARCIRVRPENESVQKGSL